MKKLLVMMTAVALGVSAWADGFTNLTYAARQAQSGNIVGYDDTATTAYGDNVIVNWWAAGYAADAANYEQPATVKTNDNDDVFLEIETDAADPMLRTFNPIQSGAINPVALDAGNHGVFIDTKVKLTGAEEAPAAGANKLIVWLKAIPTEDNVPGTTNLMVTAGIDDGTGVIVPTNYVLSANVACDQWVQLTIRADKAGDNGTFKIYVDETLATGTLEGDSSVTGVESFLSLTPGAANQALSAAGFEGTGALEYVNLADALNAPAWAADQTVVTFNYDANVASITVDDVALTLDPQGTSVDFPVTAWGDAKDYVAVITYKNGYCQKSLTTANMLAAVENPTDTVTFSVARYAPATVTIQSKLARDEVALTIDGEPVAETFASMKDVVDYIVAAGKASSVINIQLKLDETASDFGDFSQLANVTIDLAGHSLTASADWAPAWDPYNGFGMITVGADNTLTVKDTIGGGAIIGSIESGAEIWTIYNSGTAILEVAANNNPIEYVGRVYNEAEGGESESHMTIKDGKFNPVVGVTAELIEAGYFTLPKGKVFSAEPDADGFYTLVDEEVPEYVAEVVGGEQYETLAEAVAVGGNVRLLTNVTENITIAAGKTVNLNLNGFTLTGKTATYTINNLGTLTLGGGTVNDSVTPQNTLIRNGENATMTINNGTYSSHRIVIKNDESNDKEKGISGTGGTLYINGGTFTTEGDGEYNWDALLNWGTATIAGGTFNGVIECAANDYWQGGVATITGGTFNSKVITIAYFNGNAAPTFNPALTISGGTFEYPVYRNIGPYANNPDPANYYDVDTAVLPEPYASAENQGVMTINAGTARFKTKPADAVIADGYKFVKADQAEYWTVAALQNYAITFEVGGQADYVTNVVEGTEVATVAPAAPTKTGYTFAGWTPALEGVVESNATYTATFTANTYNITYTWKVEGEVGTIAALANDLPTTFTYDGAAPALDAPLITLGDTYTAAAFDPAVIVTTTAEDIAVTITLTKAAAQEDWDHPVAPITPGGTTTAADAWPTLAGTRLANAKADKLQAWAKDQNYNFADAKEAGQQVEEAFLLNVANTEKAVEDAKKAFKIPAISIVGDEATVTPPAGEFNGTITIHGATTVDGKYAPNTEGAKFFKAVLGF